jgi:hypothetical protein
MARGWVIAGNVRYYFRRKGEKKVRLHGIPGSKEFMDAYALALTSVTFLRRDNQDENPYCLTQKCSRG